jgi:hypothetical protein
MSDKQQTEPVQVTRCRECGTALDGFLVCPKCDPASPVAPAPTTVILAPGSAIQRAIIHFENYANDYEISCARIVEILSEFASLAPVATGETAQRDAVKAVAEFYALAEKIAKRDKWFIGGFLGEVWEEWNEKHPNKRLG